MNTMIKEKLRIIEEEMENEKKIKSEKEMFDSFTFEENEKYLFNKENELKIAKNKLKIKKIKFNISEKKMKEKRELLIIELKKEDEKMENDCYIIAKHVYVEFKNKMNYAEGKLGVAEITLKEVEKDIDYIKKIIYNNLKYC